MAVKRIWVLLLLSGCSWEYHREHVRYPFLNPQPGEYYVEMDTIQNSIHGNCNRTLYLIKKGDWLHFSSCECDEKWTVDSAFNRKGNLYMMRKNHENRSQTYLYDTSLTIYYDRKERPIQQVIYINRPDTSYEYWQYYDEFGSVEAEKRPIIYSLLGGF